MRIDAIVVGAGLGGGAAAAVLAEAGRSVLLLEQGEALGFAEDPRDHMRPLGVPARGSTATLGHRRPFVADDDVLHTVGAVGGGTLVWGMQAWRFHPDDFRMASRYGVPAGSSLADWPVDYADLEPWYARAEAELGVAGDDIPYAPRSTSYPLPAIESDPVADWLAAGAAAKGWSTLRPPVAVNSRPYNGREACIMCSECLGFTCPVDAKNGSHNTYVPRALATGLCTLVTGAQATAVSTDAHGRVTGIEYLAAGERRSATSRIVVLAGGAIETARLLLSSMSKHHPRGIGNHADHVGRHLQGHTYPVAVGVLPAGIVNPNRGPRITVGTTEFAHHNPGVIGGAMIANNFVATPVTFWRSLLPPDVPRWGLANKVAMRELYLRAVDVRGPVQEIPLPDNRVTLHPRLRDASGRRLACVPGLVHPETTRTADFIRARLFEWLEASGAERRWSPAEPTRGFADWFHQAGTCRMSADPADGVVDASGRIHGHDNVFVADGSVHVTNGGFNPALTILALALRTASAAASHL